MEALKRKVGRDMQKDLNPVETRKAAALQKKAGRDKQIESNPVETRKALALKEKASRNKQIELNPVETRKAEALRRKVSRDKQISRNPIQVRKCLAQKRRKVMRKSHTNEFQRRFSFLDSVRKGPIFPCICCHRIRFEKSVRVFDENARAETL